MKLGKRPAEPKPQDFKLATYVDLSLLPKPTAIFGFGKLYPHNGLLWEMLGNDQYGDCVFAGGAHETMVWNRLRHGHDVIFSDESVLSDYSAVTGFDPADPNTDQGTYVHEAMSYRRQTGLLDGSGTRHKIAAYVSIEPKDFDAIVQAMYIFGCVGIGFEFPASAWDQFDNHQKWDVVDPNSPIDGGHYVPGVGSVRSSSELTVITWGRRQVMTRAFVEAYSDEAWVPLSEEQIRADGTGIHGVNWATLQADLAAL